MADNPVPVQRVTAKLPAFWVGKPEKWFNHIEAQFIISNITTSMTKAAYVVAALDENTSDLIDNIALDGDDPYAEIKTALTRACAKTVRERVTDLLAVPSMGAERPSRYATRLLQLASDIEAKDFLREIFLRGLPSNIRETLINDTSELTELAMKADSFFTTSGATINAVDASDNFEQINAASQRNNRPPARRNERQNQNQGFRPPQSQGGGDRQPVSSSRDNQSFTLCRYHQKWGHDAQRCTPPCLMSPGNAEAGARK